MLLEQQLYIRKMHKIHIHKMAENCFYISPNVTSSLSNMLIKFACNPNHISQSLDIVLQFAYALHIAIDTHNRKWHETSAFSVGACDVMLCFV